MKCSFGIAATLLLTFVGTNTGEEPKRAGPDWWSLQKLVRPKPPAGEKAAWGNNAIDDFIRAGLAAKGLSPAPVADRVTLIRRVTFDLTGLPPTPEEIYGFVRNSGADPQAAYERVVDRLLASPHYGERWGRHWLDAVRFAESHGFERDQPREHFWRYRDWVIKSFKDDRPYADFVRQQLAGDVIAPVTPEGIVATGFLVAGPWDHVGLTTQSPSVRIRAREDELEEILGAVGQTFLGFTVNCARCHDHKFDPFPTRDYYRLKAVFEGVNHGDRTLLTPNQEQERKDAVARHQALSLEIDLKISVIEQRGREKVRGKIEGKDLPRPNSRWAFEGDANDQVGRLHGTLKGDAKIVAGKLVLNGKDAYLETAPLDRDLREKTLEVWLSLANLDQRGGGALTVETKDGRLFDSIVFGEKQPGRWLAGSNGYQRSRDVNGLPESTKPGETIHVAISYAKDGRITLYRNGEPYGEGYDAGSLAFRSGEARILIGKRHSGGGNAMFAGSIDEARLYDRPLSGEEIRASFKAGTDRIPHIQILMALSEEDRKELARLEAEKAKLRAVQPESQPKMLAYAALITPPAATHVLKRGESDNKLEIVAAGAPMSIKGPPAELNLKVDSPEGERRIKFADWVVSRDNPLTWRVMANRIWQHHFGEGIVRTPNDLGFNGDRPTHPELLDWLAAELRDNGGSLKKIHRLILLSATYQQASRTDAKTIRDDPENRLLSRFPSRRLEAEAVRDAMLAVSGQLNRRQGGPSFRPFTVKTFNSTFYDLFDKDEPEFNRRSIYRMAVNSARDPLLDVLDCPDPSVKTPRRATTTTPLQALTLMNNSFIQRQAPLGRWPEEKELERAMAVEKEHGLRAVCWALLNASEFVYVR
ncbi:MAG: DUF1549 domain-containing protein [Planctomycetes bacterium]|nr:DUF1549 domain-containing protein [Planctomycetota bacterium]